MNATPNESAPPAPAGDAPAPAAPLAAGARVVTAYGRGSVVAARGDGADAANAVYEVRLAYGTAYMRADAVRARAPEDLDFSEILADADAQRARGNAAFAARDFDAAIDAYQQVAVVLSFSRGELTSAQQQGMRDAVVKALSNSAQAHISHGDEKGEDRHARAAIKNASDVSAGGGRAARRGRRAAAAGSGARVSDPPYPSPPPPLRSPRASRLTARTPQGSARSCSFGARLRTCWSRTLTRRRRT